jgi:Transglycosylase SLT domain
MFRRFLAVPLLLVAPVLTLLLTPWGALAYGVIAPLSSSDFCRGAIAAAERQWRIPDRLMAAIGVVESGKRDASGVRSPWPWTINAEGIGHWFDSKAEAIAAVQALQTRGVRSIDVGCLQVNLMHHPDAFASLDQAFDPVANAAYAGRFLTQLYEQTGTWPKATAGYHSLTPEVGGPYAEQVMAVWQRQPQGEPTRAFASVQPGAAGMAGGVSGLGGGTTGAGRLVLPPTGIQLYGGGRIFAMLGGPTPGPVAGLGGPQPGTGRTLASYRAAPTRLAMILPR